MWVPSHLRVMECRWDGTYIRRLRGSSQLFVLFVFQTPGELSCFQYCITVHTVGQTGSLVFACPQFSSESSTLSSLAVVCFRFQIWSHHQVGGDKQERPVFPSLQLMAALCFPPLQAPPPPQLPCLLRDVRQRRDSGCDSGAASCSLWPCCQQSVTSCLSPCRCLVLHRRPPWHRRRPWRLSSSSSSRRPPWWWPPRHRSRLPPSQRSLRKQAWPPPPLELLSYPRLVSQPPPPSRRPPSALDGPPLSDTAASRRAASWAPPPPGHRWPRQLTQLDMRPESHTCPHAFPCHAFTQVCRRPRTITGPECSHTWSHSTLKTASLETLRI